MVPCEGYGGLSALILSIVCVQYFVSLSLRKELHDRENTHKSYRTRSRDCVAANSTFTPIVVSYYP